MTTAPSTVLHGRKEAYDFSESSDKKDSPPLLPGRPTVRTTHDEDPAKLIAAIAESEHRRNLAFIENVGKVDRISCRAKTLMESTRLVAESMSTNTANFMARLDGMDDNLAAIKHLLEESMVPSASKLADKNATAMKLLSAQAVLFNEQRFKQGQAAFHRVQDVENLVTDFKSASATVTRALEESVPKTLQSVLEQNIPPPLQTILGETISPMLCNVLEGTFPKFTSRYESVGGAVIREVQAMLELQRKSLATKYSSVQSGIHKVLNRVRTLDGTKKFSPPNNSDPGGARNVNWSNPPHSMRAGDHVGSPGAQDDKRPRADVQPTHVSGASEKDDGQRGSTNVSDHGNMSDADWQQPATPTRHPSFPQGRVEDFDFSHRNVNSSPYQSQPGSAKSLFKSNVPPDNTYRPSRPTGLTLTGDTAWGDSDDEET
jgi:hypothetical protein